MSNNLSLTDSYVSPKYNSKKYYDFESFEKGGKVSHFPLNAGMTLKLPDGLSEYMDSTLNIAKVYKYEARWTEIWK